MKQFLLLFVLASSFIGCSGNGDDEPESSSDFLIGAWMGTSFTRDGVTYDTSSCVNLNPKALHRTFIFLENGSMYYKDTCKAEGREGTYTFKKGVLTIGLAAEVSTTAVTMISENQIKISYAGGDFILKKSY